MATTSASDEMQKPLWAVLRHLRRRFRWAFRLLIASDGTRKAPDRLPLTSGAMLLGRSGPRPACRADCRRRVAGALLPEVALTLDPDLWAASIDVHDVVMPSAALASLMESFIVAHLKAMVAGGPSP